MGLLQKYREYLPLFASDTSPELRTWQWLSVIGGTVAFVLPVDVFGVSLCFFYNVSGVPCPGCGLTRSVHFALHGGWLHAFYYHPVGLFGAGLIAFFLLTAIWRAPGRLFERCKQHTATAIVVGAAVLIGFGAFRVWHLRAHIFGDGIAAAGASPVLPGASPRDEFGWPEYRIGPPPVPADPNDREFGFEIVLDRARLNFWNPAR